MINCTKEEADQLYDDILFIDTCLDFYSYKDFKNNSIAIKKRYNLLPIRIKKIYQWYVYSRDITYSQKNRIWEFLNAYEGEKYYL